MSLFTSGVNDRQDSLGIRQSACPQAEQEVPIMSTVGNGLFCDVTGDRRCLSASWGNVGFGESGFAHSKMAANGESHGRDQPVPGPRTDESTASAVDAAAGRRSRSRTAPLRAPASRGRER